MELPTTQLSVVPHPSERVKSVKLPSYPLLDPCKPFAVRVLEKFSRIFWKKGPGRLERIRKIFRKRGSEGNEFVFTFWSWLFLSARVYASIQTTAAIVDAHVHLKGSFPVTRMIGYIIAVLLSEVVVFWIIMYRPLSRVLHPSRHRASEMKSPLVVICNAAKTNALVSQKWTYLCKLLLLVGAVGQAFIVLTMYANIEPLFQYVSTDETKVILIVGEALQILLGESTLLWGLIMWTMCFVLHLNAIIVRVECLTDKVRRRGAEGVMENILSYAEICRNLIPGLCRTWSTSTIWIAISAIFYVSVAVFFQGAEILSADSHATATTETLMGRVRVLDLWTRLGWRLLFPIFILVMASRVTAACAELVRTTRLSPLMKGGDMSREHMREKVCGELGSEISQLSELLENAQLGFRLGTKSSTLISFSRTATILGSLYTLMLYSYNHSLDTRTDIQQCPVNGTVAAAIIKVASSFSGSALHAGCADAKMMLTFNNSGGVAVMNPYIY